MTTTDTPAATPTTTTPAATDIPATTGDAVFGRARDWLYDQGEPRWIAEAFGHWVTIEIAPHEVLRTWGALMSRWHHEPTARVYRARHGARVTGSPPWWPGDSLPPPQPVGPRVR